MYNRDIKRSHRNEGNKKEEKLKSSEFYAWLLWQNFIKFLLLNTKLP